ncbi:MAG: hypothetical protein V3S66_01265 [Desulfobacterales bacterium]
MGDPSDHSKPNRDAFLWTRRLFFRQWSETDLELALDLWGDLRVTKFIDARGELTVDEVRNRLEQEIASARIMVSSTGPSFFRQPAGMSVVVVCGHTIRPEIFMKSDFTFAQTAGTKDLRQKPR